MKNFKWQLLLTGMCAMALAVGCDDKTDTGDTADAAGGDGTSVPGPGDGPGTTTTDDTGTTTGPGTTPSDDTALAAIAFYISGTADPGSTGDMAISGEFSGERGIIGYGIDGGYVDFDTLYCVWATQNSVPALPVECDECEYAFAVSFDTPVEGGDDCGVFDESLGPYGYTGPEVFVSDIDLGFVKAGSGTTSSGFEYDYGGAAFYIGYPYYYWYTSYYYTAFSYENYYDAALTDFYGYDGYYAVTFTQ